MKEKFGRASRRPYGFACMTGLNLAPVLLLHAIIVFNCKLQRWERQQVVHDAQKERPEQDMVNERTTSDCISVLLRLVTAL